MMLRIIQEIEQTKDNKLEGNISKFNQIRNEITSLLINGKISEGQFNILNQKISDYLNNLAT